MMRIGLVASVVVLSCGGCHSVRQGGRAALAVASVERDAVAAAAPDVAPAALVPKAPAPARPLLVGGGSARPTRATAPAKPTNVLCPVMTGTPADAAYVSVWEGKSVAFSSAEAKRRWDADPRVFAANLAITALDPFATSIERAAVAHEPAPAAPSTRPTSTVAPRIAPTPATRVAAAPPPGPGAGPSGTPVPARSAAVPAAPSAAPGARSAPPRAEPTAASRPSLVTPAPRSVFLPGATAISPVKPSGVRPSGADLGFLGQPVCKPGDPSCSLPGGG